MDLAIKDVQRHAGRFGATVAGVGLLVAIVLTMNGIHRGNIADGLWLIGNTDVDLWVVERTRGGPFNESSRIAQGLYRSVSAVPGVAKASPFVTYPVQREVAGNSQQFTIIGYDVLGGLGGPPRVISGRQIRAPRFEMVADARLGLRPGERVRFGLHELTVVGLTRSAVDMAGNPLAYMALPDAQEVVYRQDNEAIRSGRTATVRAIEGQGFRATDVDRLLPLVSSPATETIAAVLVKLRAGADANVVRAAIAHGLFLDVYTSDEQRELLLQGRLSKMSAILGLFRTLLVVVSVVIMALIVYVLTMEKIRALATLKLIGAPNRVIVRLILEQSTVLAALGFGMAYGLVALTQARFPRTLVFERFDTLITFVVILLGGVVASLFGIWRALRTPPSLALGG
jgi:putative ABC transport system permease protein